MVKRQIEARGVQDERVLGAMRKVLRHELIPDAVKDMAYEDRPLPIGHGQTISQPYIVGLMTELLELDPNDKVLEVGTGSGFQAAVLAEIAKNVYSIEIVEPLYRETKARLEKLRYENIHLKLGDGTKGWPQEAPFDKMIVTAAGINIPDSLIDQLREGGRLVMPVGDEDQFLVIGQKVKGRLETYQSIPVRFVPLIEEKNHGQET